VNARNGLIIGLLLTIVAGYGFFHFALAPKREQADALQSQIDQQQQQLDAANALLAANSTARDRYQSSYASVVRLGKAVPADDDVRSLVVQLESAARRSGIDFSSIQLNAAAAASTGAATTATTLPPGATVGPAGFPVMQFAFRFRGQFFRLGDFFQRLHGFVKSSKDGVSVTGRLLTLDSLKLEPAAEGFPKINATVNATSYLVSPLEGLTAGATAAGPAGATATGGTGAPTTSAGTTPAPTSTPGAAALADSSSTGGIR
jgi:Tfp pilus assembly protein PilO